MTTSAANPAEEIDSRLATKAGVAPASAHTRWPRWAFGLAGSLDAWWHARSLRAQLLLTVILIDVIAGLFAGGVVIFKARSATRIEIDASMNLAAVLVGETINLMPQDTPADRLLESLPLRQRFARHVRITVRDEAGIAVNTRLMPTSPETHRNSRMHAPAWFTALVSPPIERRELPIVANGRHVGSVLIAGEPADETAEAWENLKALSGVAMLVNVAMIGILYVLFGRVLDPLTGLGTGLRDLERRNYGVRLRRPKAWELAAITDRFNALAGALEAARSENATLYQRLITSQDDERRHTARELHDEVGPSLFGLKANAGSIATVAGALSDGPGRAVQERARDMLAIVDHLQQINRSLLVRLRPMSLGHVPLGDVLAEMVRDRARQHPQIAFRFAAGELAAGYGDSIDLTVYRCVQESLTNAIRHAQARNIRVNLGEAAADAATPGAPTRLEIVIEDDGCGIDPRAPAGFGLQGMQERVRALGGECAVEAGPDGGTSVRVVIPLSGRDGPRD